MLASDFGDAPTPYPTTLAEDGARHITIGPMLGASRDADSDGTHSANADHDDANTDSDEDGVTFGTIRVGQLDADATVNVQGGPARLDAWIDFNQDGSWGGAWEQIADNVLVVNGDNTIEFDVPSWAASGTSFARFRLSTAGNLGVGGEASNGEVEDFAIFVQPPEPSRVAFGEGRVVAPNLDSIVAVLATDLDGDSDMDVLSLSGFGNELIWHENDGQERFTSHAIKDDLDIRQSFLAADLDGDGDVDVFSASGFNNAWYENNGQQGFSDHIVDQFSGFREARRVTGADLDLDGDLDLVEKLDHNILVFSNSGRSIHGIKSINPLDIASFALDLADVDRDGDVDLVSGGTLVAWYENDGQFGFSKRELGELPDIYPAKVVLAADMDRDQDMDVLAVYRASIPGVGDTVVWFENDGDAQFVAHEIITERNIEHVVLADLDGDGDLDILAASSDLSGSRNKLFWFENTGKLEYSFHQIATKDQRTISSMQATDMDGDGDLDVLTAGRLDGKIVWYENTSPPSVGIAAPAIAIEGIVLTLDATSSMDLQDLNSSLTFDWDLDYDGVTFDVDVTGEQPVVSFPDDSRARNIGLRVTDTRGESDLATTTLEVINVPPTITLSGDVNVNEDTPYELTLGEITDSGQDTVVQWIVDWGDGSGSQTFMSGGVKTHVYAEGGVMHTINVDLVDEDGTHPNAGSFNITIMAVNHPPVANHQEVSTDEDTGSAITLTGTDPDGDGLSYTLLAEPEHGQLTGTFPNVSYSPAANFHGADHFTFKASDGELDSAPATVNISVVAVNDPPVAESQSATTNEDTEVAVVLAGNDVENDSLTFSLVSLPQHGTLSGDIPNLRYAPEANFHGQDTIVFTVSDEESTSSQATVTIAVTPVNDAPTVENLQFATDEDTLITFELPYSDLDGDELSIQIITGDVQGIATIVVDGSSQTLSYDPSGSDVLQALKGGTSVEETITLSVSDEKGGVRTATVVITVRGITDWQNPVQPLDANGDGEVSPIDALVIINSLNGVGPRALLPTLADPNLWYDVNGDGFISPLDALLIINRLNASSSEGEAEVSGTNEFVFDFPESSQLPARRFTPARLRLPRTESDDTQPHASVRDGHPVMPHRIELLKRTPQLQALDEFLVNLDCEQFVAATLVQDP